MSLFFGYRKDMGDLNSGRLDLESLLTLTLSIALHTRLTFFQQVMTSLNADEATSSKTPNSVCATTREI